MQDDFGNAFVPPVLPVVLRTMSQRLDDGDERMGRIEGDVSAVRKELAENTRATQSVADSTADLVEFFDAMRGAFKVLNWIGKLAKPLAYIIGLGTAAISLWAATKGAK